MQFLLCVTVPVLALLITLSFLIVYLIDKKKVDNSIKVTAVYIDFNDKIVTLFQPKTLEKSSSISYVSFCYLFYANEENNHNGEAVNIDEFISHIFEENKLTKEYFETDGITNHQSKHKYRVLFEVTNVDFEKRTLHGNIYYFDNIALFSYPTKYPSKINKYERAYKSTLFNLQRDFSPGRERKLNGASYMFTISNSYTLNSLKYNRYVYWNFFDIVAKYNKKMTKIIQHPSENVFIINDFNSSPRNVCLKYIKNISSDFYLFLQMNNLDSMYKLTCACLEHQNTKADYLLAMKDLRNVMQIALEQNKPYLFFDFRLSNKFYFDEASTTEAKKVIESNQFLYLYEPIYNCVDVRMFGWFCVVDCSNNLFRNIIEIEQYAIKLDLLNHLMKTIMTTVVDKATRELASYSEEARRVYLNVSVNDIEPILRWEKYLSNAVKNVRLIFVFDESNIRDNYGDETIIEKIDDIKLHNKIALSINNQNLVLPNEIYERFDYFIFNSNQVVDAKDSAHEEFVLKKSMEKVLRYRKRLLFKGVKTLNEVEFRLKTGLKYLSGPAIGLPNEMFIPLDPKVVDRIKKIEGKNK